MSESPDPGPGIRLADASAPAGTHLYAIGDIHGRLDLLQAMHARIEADLARNRPADWRIIHLGDYVDRGPESKGVLDFLIAARRRDPRFVMLAGNHDTGFLEFLASPDPGGLFMRFGGVQTALSYGVALAESHAGSVALASQAFVAGHAALLGAVPPAHVEFLQSLPTSFSAGDFFFCHAGIRPGIALEEQSPVDLIWIRNDFLGYPGLHAKVIVHGHTPVYAPEVLDNRVNVDTGAFKTGQLSALAVEGREKRTFSVSL